MEMFGPLAGFLEKFGIPVGMVLIFALLMVSKPKGSTNPYLITGSAVDAKDREISDVRADWAADKADWQRRYDEDRAEWIQREARERSQRMQSEQRLAETIATMDRVIDVMSELRVDLARALRIEPPK